MTCFAIVFTGDILQVTIETVMDLKPGMQGLGMQGVSCYGKECGQYYGRA
jgi:hypothetical protein